MAFPCAALHTIAAIKTPAQCGQIKQNNDKQEKNKFHNLLLRLASLLSPVFRAKDAEIGVLLVLLSLLEKAF